MATQIIYNGTVIGTVTAGQSKILKCNGKKMKSDVEIRAGERTEIKYDGAVIATVEAGSSKTIKCSGKTMKSNIEIRVEDDTPGKDGVSPTVEMIDIEGGTRIIITDVNGPKSTDIMDGKDGPKGDKGDPGEKGENGAQGPKGDKGDKGDTGAQGAQGIQGIQGEKGADGAKGDKGDKGDPGADGKDGVDGKNGSDGVGIKSVVQTTTSSLDGGSNVITVTKTDDTTSTFTVKNGREGSDGKDGYTPIKGVDYFDGKDGSDGRDGADGKTPVKGVDYYTEADKAEIVAAVIESLGGNPIFGIVDENNNIIVNGDLPDGTYTVKYEMEGGKIINIGNLVLDSNVYYTVTKNLTNCTISNSATQAVKGGSYSATITANDGFELKSVSVTMGGSPVTVTGGNISIANVTGDIVITAVAEEAKVEINNLAQPDATATGEAAWNSGGWCNNSYMAGSSYAYRSATDGRLTTNTIAVEYGDTIYVKGIDYASATYPQVAVFDASGAKLSHGYAQYVYNNGYINELSASTGSDYWSFTLTSASGDRGVRFVRFAGYPSGDISDIIITRNQPIE